MPWFLLALAVGGGAYVYNQTVGKESKKKKESLNLRIVPTRKSTPATPLLPKRYLYAVEQRGKGRLFTFASPSNVMTAETSLKKYNTPLVIEVLTKNRDLYIKARKQLGLTS